MTLLLGIASAATYTCQVYSTADGSVGYGQDGSWVSQRNASIGDSISTTAGFSYLVLSSTSTAGTFNLIQREIIVLPTADCHIPANATINSADVVLKMYKDTMSWSPAFGVGITSQRMGSYTTIATADYGKSDDSKIAESKAYADISQFAYNTYAITNLTALNRNTNTAVSVRWEPDITNTIPSGTSKSAYVAIFNNETSGTGSDPYMNITWTEYGGDGGDTTPPLGVTGLTNETPTCNQINFVWTNPPSDFDHNMLWLNNTALPNSSASYYLATGLPLDKDITLSLKTSDPAGNINATIQNTTAHTLATCPATNYFPNGKYDYYAYGDSITEDSDYFLGQMKSLFNNTATVGHNTDGAGMSSDWGLAQVNNAFHNNGTQFYVMFGVNDMNNVQTGLQVGQNLDQICDAVEMNGSTCHILIKTMAAEDGFGYGYANYTMQQDNDTIIQNYLTSTAGRTYIKAYDAIDTIPCNGVPDKWNSSFMTDSLHPNTLGHEYIARYVWNSTEFCDAYFPTATPTPTPTTTVTTIATTVETTTATPTPTQTTTSPTPTPTPGTGIVAGFNGTICFNFYGTNSTPVDTWSWSFGDGDTSYLQNNVHCYIWGKKYTATLTVTNGTESAIFTNSYDLTGTG
jgi:lysophospholipase L1-like esterase